MPPGARLFLAKSIFVVLVGVAHEADLKNETTSDSIMNLSFGFDWRARQPSTNTCWLKSTNPTSIQFQNAVDRNAGQRCPGTLDRSGLLGVCNPHLPYACRQVRGA